MYNYCPHGSGDHLIVGTAEYQGSAGDIYSG